MLQPTIALLTSPACQWKCYCELIASTRKNNKTFTFCVVVVETTGTNLLSLGMVTKIGLIQRIKELCEDIFGSCGLLKTSPVKIMLKNVATPHCVTMARRIPFPIIGKVK